MDTQKHYLPYEHYESYCGPCRFRTTSPSSRLVPNTSYENIQDCVAFWETLERASYELGDELFRQWKRCERCKQHTTTYAIAPRIVEE